MGKIRNTASGLRVGRVGNTTYYVANNQQIVRTAQNDSNYGTSASRSQSQQANRVKWSNLVSFYKLSAGWMRKAYETRRGNQSDYNRFMQINKPTARISLTKDAALNGACVIDSYIVSQGSLPSVIVDPLTSGWQTNINLTGLTITSETTVAEFAAAAVANNSWISMGMQISFISYQQTVNALGFPVAVCTAYEVTLDAENSNPLRSYLPDFCSQVSEAGFLATNDNISVGGFAYILSQTVSGKTKVSSQTLITNNDKLISQYSSFAAMQEAIESYGVNADAFLDSGSEEVPVTPAMLYIEYLYDEADELTYRPMAGAPDMSVISEHRMRLKMSGKFAAGKLSQTIDLYGDSSALFGEKISFNVVDNDIEFRMPTVAIGDGLYALAITIDGRKYKITFAEQPFFG